MEECTTPVLSPCSPFFNDFPCVEEIYYTLLESAPYFDPSYGDRVGSSPTKITPNFVVSNEQNCWSTTNRYYAHAPTQSSLEDLQRELQRLGTDEQHYSMRRSCMTTCSNTRRLGNPQPQQWQQQQHQQQPKFNSQLLFFVLPYKSAPTERFFSRI